MKKTGKNEKVKMKNEKLFIIHCSLFIAAALCGGCMSPSGETGRSIRNTQNIRDCLILVNMHAAPASSNAVAALDGVMPEIKVLSVDGLIAADHNGDRQGSTTSVSDLLKQSGGSTASIFDALFGSVVRAVASPTIPAAQGPDNKTTDCPDGKCAPDAGENP